MTPVSAWELGGLSLSPTAAARPLVVPSDVILVDESIRSRPLTTDARRIAVPTDLLLRFARITTAEDALAFARRYGVLRLEEARTRDGWYEESVAYWMQLSRRVRALLNIASALHRDRTTALADWAIVYEATPRRDVPWLDGSQPPPTSIARMLLAMTVNQYVEAFKTVPVFEWTERVPRITFHSNLPAALAGHLLIAVAAAEGLAVCSACGLPYARTGRQTKRRQRNYCPSCGRRAAWRLAARAHRAARPTRPPTPPERRTGAARDAKLLALTKVVGVPPRRHNAGAYWQAFHAEAVKRGLVRGRSSVASRMAYARAVHRRSTDRLSPRQR